MTAPADTSNRLGFAEVRIAAAGRWGAIVRGLGINLPASNKHTACPGCGGKDRFRLMPDFDSSGRWICGGGGDTQSGDGFGLLSHVHGWTLAESLRAVADHLGLTRLPDHQRAAIRLQADRQAAQMQAAARRKDEQARRDSNMVLALYDLADTIKHRQWMQRQASKIDGQAVIAPPPDEVQAIRDLITAAIDGYKDFLGEANA